MSIIIADVDIADRDDPTRSLVTLSVLTGAVMIVAGALRLGTFLRFVSNSVMTGFITAVGINIVLGQLDDFTGYEAEGGNRVSRAVDLLFNLGQVDVPTLAVGVVTVVGIVWLQRTRLGALGLVVAVGIGSALAQLLEAIDQPVALVGDVADVPSSLPLPTLPILDEIPSLLVPAASLAFVGLVQGAGVSASFPGRDGELPDTSQDFVGQGAGNLVSGVFQGMPVGGSMSASSLVVTAGARSRGALLIAGVVMAAVIVLFAGVVELIAMPALAGLLIVVGVGTVKPAKVMAIAHTGPVPMTVMLITLVLTMLIPLQYAVLVGVGISVLLFVIGQSSRLVTRQLVLRDDGTVAEVVVLQPYGAIFFASASVLLDQMPEVTPATHRSVVILRIRGADDAGVTFIDTLARYAAGLAAADSKLIVVTDNERLVRQLRQTGTTSTIGEENVYLGTEVVGETTRRAHADALEWIADGTGTNGGAA
jgi:SulP family sulfate permease